MLTVKPEEVKFESTNDVIDYVTLGLPPTKKNYKKLRNAIGEYPIPGKDGITISKGAFIELDREDLQLVLDRVYADNRRNRNFVLGICGIAALATLGAIFCGSSKKDKDHDE